MIPQKSKEHFSLVAILFVTFMSIVMAWSEGVKVIDGGIFITSAICIFCGILYFAIQISQHLEKEELRNVDLSLYIGWWIDRSTMGVDGKPIKKRPIRNPMKRQDKMKEKYPNFIDRGGAF